MRSSFLLVGLLGVIPTVSMSGAPQERKFDLTWDECSLTMAAMTEPPKLTTVPSEGVKMSCVQSGEAVACNYLDSDGQPRNPPDVFAVEFDERGYLFGTHSDGARIHVNWGRSRTILLSPYYDPYLPDGLGSKVCVGRVIVG